MVRAIKISATILLVVSIFFILNGFLPHLHSKKIKASPHDEYLLNLRDSSEFSRYAGTPLLSKYNGVTSIKVVYDLHDSALYFVNSAKFKYHIDFCTSILGYRDELQLFNQTNYTDSKWRKYILANLNYVPELHTYAIEFVSEDIIKPHYIELLYESIRQHSFIKNNLRLLMNSDYLTGIHDSLQSIPKLTTDEVYQSLRYQAIYEGRVYGRMVWANENNNNKSHLEDILVVKGTPLYIPPSRGIITNQFQTPLSHIQVLAHNNKLPSFAYKSSDKKLEQWKNQWVRLDITSDSFHVEPVTEAIARQYTKPNPPQSQTLESDTLTNDILPLKKCQFRDKKRIGNKAANLAVLERISASNRTLFNTPEGSFAIPFFYYKKHISSPSIRTAISFILQNETEWTEHDLDKALKHLRDQIKQQPIDPILLNRVENMIIQNHCGNEYRFRSSSNAEDAFGFSGAGIYDSKTGILHDTTHSIEEAIKKVWASTWSLQAFLARKNAGIKHEQVMMAVLCHRRFPDEGANGVVVTKNIYRPSFPGYTANVQIGEISVVQPDEHSICDQFTFFQPTDFNPFTNDVAVDYITIGNRNNGKKVLTHEQVNELYRAVAVCDDYYASQFYRNCSYDIEFKFEKGKLYLKQIRPYY